MSVFSHMQKSVSVHMKKQVFSFRQQTIMTLISQQRSHLLSGEITFLEQFAFQDLTVLY